MERQRPKRIAIVGGGITGIAAAHAIAQANAQLGWGVECTLIEGSPRFGGKVQTEEADGFLVEQGPDSMLARKVEARQFCQAVGLGEDLVGSNQQHGGTFVVRQGHLEPLPESMVLVAPTRLRPWLKTRLLSTGGKLRAALDLVLPAREGDDDESLVGLVRRRMGNEVAERLAVPLLASVYGGGSGDLSVLATFPELRSLERRYRSLLLGLRATAARRNGAARPGNAKAGSVFVSLRHGMHSMVSRGVAQLAGTHQLLGAAVTRLSLTGQQHGQPRYSLQLADGSTVQAEGVILATPAFATQQLLEPLCPDAAEALAGIDYQDTIVVVVAYPRERVQHPLNGTGFLVPESEQRHLIACTWLSPKWPHTSDPDKALLRCYVGGRDAAALMDLPDEALVALVEDELRELLGTEGWPIFSRVYRWKNAIPRYALGHLERVHCAEAALKQVPALAIAGAGYHGIGVPDCIRQGQAAAAALLGIEPLADGQAFPMPPIASAGSAGQEALAVPLSTHS